ncbi:MAG: sensor histidine kinase [Planctomycetota bacterium]|jgi:two-component system NtrC family sensor kinase
MKTLAVRLLCSFLFVIVITSAVFGVLGIRFIDNRVLAEAQDKVQTDLNAAREFYLFGLGQIHDAVRFTAERFSIRDALLGGDLGLAADVLTRTQTREQLDFLTVTDREGVVLFRSSNPGVVGDSRADDELVRAVLDRNEPVAATSIVAADDLRNESPALAERARIKVSEDPQARPRDEAAGTAGMVWMAAAPIHGRGRDLAGVLYGGILLNRDSDLVDRIKRTVFKDVQYRGKDIGTATLFQDGVRISTNVTNGDGTRALGTRVSEEVYDRVVGEGLPWIGRGHVVDDWYIAAYEPIRNLDENVIGILHVGVLEQKYRDIKSRAILLLLGSTLAAAALATGVSYFISTRISGPIGQLVSASRELAKGNLDARVGSHPVRELGELADAFNFMASTLKKRDVEQKEFARKKIMESERLAIIGQLAADVAHELNNPLQGIVAYSHLLLEGANGRDASTTSINKIVAQADRCTKIIRGLLDFSRQRKPQKQPCDINGVLEDCLSLVETQALFHNIGVDKRLHKALPRIVMDPSQVQQVFMNMIINAAEAMSGNGRLLVRTRFARSSGLAVAVDFTDTGQGISVENMDRIFDPFFTTKEVGHGTGLGLAISYGIIKEHKGSVSVESAVGEGTTFTVRLPVTVAEAVSMTCETEAES